METAIALFAFYCLVHLVAWWHKRHAEHKSGWKAHLYDRPPRIVDKRRLR
jgi:hypothetical protein